MIKKIIPLYMLILFVGCSHNPPNLNQIPLDDSSDSVEKEKLRVVFQANIKDIKKCYEEGLKNNPDLKGKFIIQFTIGPSGKVLEAGIKSSSLKSREVENCSVAKLKSWKFPSPPVNNLMVVSYPFVFETED